MTARLSLLQRLRMRWIAHGAKPQAIHLPENLVESRRFLFCLPPDPRAQMLARAFLPRLVPILGERQVTPPSGGVPNRQQRVPLGTLPALPFEILKQ